MSAQTWTHFPSGVLPSRIVGADSTHVYIDNYRSIIKWNMATHAEDSIVYPSDLLSCESFYFLELAPNGDIWAGTLNSGVWRYANGVWTNFNTTNSSINSDDVYGIEISRLGAVYINRYFSVSRFDGLNWTAIDSSNSTLRGGRIGGIYTGTNSVILSEDNNAIRVYNGQSWSSIDTTVIPELSYKFNNDIVAIDSGDHIWTFFYDSMGMASLVDYTSPNVYVIRPFNSIFCNGVSKILGSKFSNRLLAMDYSSVQISDAGGCSFFNAPSMIFPENIVEDKRGNVWMFKDSFLYKYDVVAQQLSTAWKVNHVPTSEFNSRNSYYSSMEDENHHLWFGSWGKNAVLEYDGLKFKEYYFGISTLNSFEAVQTMICDKSTGIKYFGLPNANISYYDGVNWYKDTALNYPHYGDYPAVGALAIDRNQQLIVGFDSFSTSGVRPVTAPGIAIKSGGVWTLESLQAAGCSTNQVFTLAVDTFHGKNDCWMGTVGGGIMVRTGANTYTHFTTANSPIPNDTIQHIAIDHLGRKWIGTFNGLAIYNDTSWVVFSGMNNPFPGSDIEYIAFNPYDNNRPWVAVDGGVCKWQDSVWICYTECATPLHFGDVESIVFDQHGNTWLPNEGPGDAIASIDRISNSPSAALLRINGQVKQSNGLSFTSHLVELYQKTPSDLLLLSSTHTNLQGDYTFITDKQNVFVKSTFENGANLAVYQGGTLVRQEALPVIFNAGKAVVNLQHLSLTQHTGHCTINGTIRNAGILKYPTQIYLISTLDQSIVSSYTFPKYSNVFYFDSIPTGSYKIAVDRFGVVDSLCTTVSVSVEHPYLQNLVYFLHFDHLELIDGGSWPSGIAIQGNADAEVKIYPIPTSQNLTIDWTSQDAQKAEVKVYDVLGNEMKAESFLLNVGANSRSLSLSDLSDGFYCLSLISGEKELKRKIMVKH